MSYARIIAWKFEKNRQMILLCIVLKLNYVYLVLLDHFSPLAQPLSLPIFYFCLVFPADPPYFSTTVVPSKSTFGLPMRPNDA